MEEKPVRCGLEEKLKVVSRTKTELCARGDFFS